VGSSARHRLHNQLRGWPVSSNLAVGFIGVKFRPGDRAGLSVYADGVIIGSYQPLVPDRLSRIPKTRLQVDCLGCGPGGRHDGRQGIMLEGDEADCAIEFRRERYGSQTMAFPQHA